MSLEFREEVWSVAADLGFISNETEWAPCQTESRERGGGPEGWALGTPMFSEHKDEKGLAKQIEKEQPVR